MQILLSMVLGSAGALALWGLYRALQLNWPEQYASLNDTFALRLNQSFWRFFLYRFVPVFAAGIALWATSVRLNLVPVVAIAAMLLIHLLHTNALALAQSFGQLQVRQEFTINYAAYHLMAIGLAVAASVAAIFLGKPLEFLVPPPKVLIENLWVAVFIAIAGGVAVSVIGKRPDGAQPFDPHYFVWRAERDVGIDLTDNAYQAAIENRCDPILLRAIMFAEALQRPKWVRNVEHAKGRFFKRGSYGVTQEYSDRPISDEESIRLTAQALSHRWALAEGDWGLAAKDGLIWKYASQHNPDARFIQGVQQVYVALQYSTQAQMYQLDSKDIKVLEVRRYAHHFGFRAVTISDVLVFEYTPASGKPQQTRIERPSDVSAPNLWAFEMGFDVDVDLIAVSLTGFSGTSFFEIPISATISS